MVSASRPSLSQVAVYRRTVHASAERVWENVHDWEHLPWLHRKSFFAIEMLDAGDWGWRARIGLQPEVEARWIELELVLARDEPRYVSRTLAGPGAGNEIWTSVGPEGLDRTEIQVEFWLADTPPAHAKALGQTLTRLYTRLWDEDEAMMTRRADLLGRRRPEAGAGTALALGTLASLRPRLPLVVEHAGRSWRIVEHAGALHAHATVCPHALGPLEEAELDDGCVVCPWHGRRFRLTDGRCSGEARLRLPRAPALRVDSETGDVQLG